VSLVYTKNGLEKKSFSNGYTAVDAATRDGLSYERGSADYFMRDSRTALVNESRDFDRNNMIYESVVNRAVDNILGSNGFTLNVTTPSRYVNEYIEKELWADFALYPEMRGMHSWHEIESIVLRDLIVAGDVLANKARKQGKLQIIESERIQSPWNEKNVEQGVEMSSLGVPIRYWISQNPDTYYGGNYAKISAKDCIFVGNFMKRVSATRGIPALTSAFPNIHRINDILDSEAIAWQLLSRFAVSVTQKEAGGPDSEVDPLKSGTDGDVTSRIHDVDQGTIFWGEDGESINGITQDRPASNFSESIRMYLRLLGNPLGIPLELVLLDWSQTNYSSARASLEQAYLAFERWQQLMIRQFHTRVYKWKVGEWMAKGLIPNGKEYLRHEWITPPFPWVDPEKEANAWGVRLDRNLTTLTEAQKSLNIDPDDQAKTAVADMVRAINSAASVKKQTGVEVPWQYFSGTDIGKTQLAVIDNDSNSNDTSEKEEPDEGKEDE